MIESKLEISDLLAHRGWRLALARGLVSPGQSPEDAVQATWLAALSRPPRGGSSARRGSRRCCGTSSGNGRAPTVGARRGTKIARESQT